MTTITSSPDRFGSFLCGLLKKNRPTMIYLFVLGFIGMPVQYASQMFRHDVNLSTGAKEYLNFYTMGDAGLYTGASLIMMVILWMVATLIIGISGTNYMQNRRAVDLYHSLPLSRHQLMLARFTGSFITVALPLTVDYILTMILAVIRRGYAPLQTEFSLGLSLMDLLGWYVTVFAVLAIILLMATQVGSTFDTFLFSGVFLAALPILYTFHDILCSTILYGYGYDLNGRIVSCLSPATLMSGKYITEVSGWKNAFGGALAAWLALGVLILLLALHQYKKRPSERAESTAHGGVASFLFRLLAVFVGGTGLGMIFYSVMFNNGHYDQLLPLLLSVAVFGALVFLLVEAILCRGFRGIEKKSFLTGGILILISMIYIGGLCTGGFGFEQRVPTVEEIKSVTINYRGRYEYVSLFDAADYTRHNDTRNDGSIESYYSYESISDTVLTGQEALGFVTKLHSDILADYRGDSTMVETNSNTEYNVSCRNIEVIYRLKNGTKLRRYYYVIVSGELRDDIEALEDTDEFRRKTCPLYDWTEETNWVDSISVTGPAGITMTTLEGERASELTAALRADALRESAADYYDPARETVAYLYLESNWTDKWGQKPAEEDFWSSCTIPVSDTYTETLALLREWGVLEQVDDSGWNFARAFCWGCDDTGSGLIVFPTWYGEKNVNEGYASAELTREEAETLLALSTFNHPNNGGDDCLYLCLGTKTGDKSVVNLPRYLSIEAALAANIPVINDMIEEYYGWKREESQVATPQPVIPEAAETITVE